jgi:hypothetical protein
MSNTRPSKNHARHLLTAISKAPRKLRIAGLAGLITVASTAALIAAPAAANASTTTANPTCAVPAGTSYKFLGETGTGTRLNQPPFLFLWEDSVNGVNYIGVTLRFVSPLQAKAEGLVAFCSIVTP